MYILFAIYLKAFLPFSLLFFKALIVMKFLSLNGFFLFYFFVHSKTKINYAN